MDNLLLQNMELNDIERIHGYIKYRLGLGRSRAKQRGTNFVTFKLPIDDTVRLMNIIKYAEMEKDKNG